MPPFDVSLIILGILGGALPDILRIIKTRHGKNLPTYLKNINFWLGFFLLLAIGGLAAWLLGAKDAKEAFAFGFGAPEILSNLLATPKVERTGAVVFGLREWWSN